MVKLEAIKQSNTSFKHQHHKEYVCVFIGATSGIGLATLRKLVTMLDSSTFYVLGRSSFESELEHLQTVAPSARFVFIQTQASLISSIDAASKEILASEKKVDLLCMSPGGIPYQGAVYTEEGIETSFAISYYSRLRLTYNLLPLLQKSPQPRVLSILNGAKESPIREDDVGLMKKWSILDLIKHTRLSNSLAFDYLAANDDSKITFIHDSPGLVNTGSPGKLPARKDGFLRWAIVSVLKMFARWLIRRVGYSLAEAGERHAYLLTTSTISPGSWRANAETEIVEDNAALRDYSERGWAQKIWDHTLQVWEKARGA